MYGDKDRRKKRLCSLSSISMGIIKTILKVKHIFVIFCCERICDFIEFYGELVV